MKLDCDTFHVPTIHGGTRADITYKLKSLNLHHFVLYTSNMYMIWV